MARLVSLLWLLCSGLAWANLPRVVQTFSSDSLNQLTNVTRNNTITISGATPAPATNVTVNGHAAQLYGDMTFAATNLALNDGSNSFTDIAVNAYGLWKTNIITANLPVSVAVQWDSNGNLTNDGARSFAYNAENQLTNITVAGAWKTDFVFDGLGRKRVERDYGWQVGQWAKTNELHFIYDGWLLVQVRDSNNAVLVTYTRGLDLSGSLAAAGGIGGLLARSDANGSTFYHADGGGNITGLMDGLQNIAARYMYGPFGNTILQSGPMAGVNRLMFASKMGLLNTDDMYDFGERIWFTRLDRWGSRDPLGELGDRNLYRGMFNSPLNAVDPYGLQSWIGAGYGSMPLPHYPDNGGPSLGQTAGQVGSSWVDNVVNSLLGFIGMTMQDPTGDPHTQQQLNAMAQTAQQQLGSPMAQNGFYQPGSQEDVVGTGLFVLMPVPFMKGDCPPKNPFKVNPSKLRLPPTRPEGADLSKLARQIKQYGNSFEGMPPIQVTLGANGEMMINDGVTRATRAAMSPGSLVPAQIIENNPALNLQNLPTVGQALSGK